jgi:hypothetical protein
MWNDSVEPDERRLLMQSRWLPAVMAMTALTALAAGVARGDTRLTGHIVDAESGEPVAARLYIQSDKGQWFFARSASPQGSAVEYRKQYAPTVAEMHTTLSPHAFVADLPAGRYTLTVERGKEYLTAEQQVTIGDDPVDVKLPIRRWIDMAALGWYSGDTHVHRGVDELRNVIMAEDVNVALPLTSWVTRAYVPPSKGDKTNAAAPTGLIRVDPTHVIYPVNTEYELFTVGGARHMLGAVIVLNHKQPITLGAPPVAPVAAEARRQGAILDLDKHTWPWTLMIVPIMHADLFELANNHVWRTNFGFPRWTFNTLPDGWGVETDQRGFTERGWIDFGFKTYYALLNCGFRMRPTGGTGSGVHPVQLGFGRVYVELPDGFSYDAWMAGLNAGRSFVTTGPMLRVRFNDQPAGQTFADVKADRWPLHVTGTAHSATPLDRVEVVVNGRVAATIAPTNRPRAHGGFDSVVDTTVTLDYSSWAAVRCFQKLPDGRERYAHTAPVHIDMPGRPLHPHRVETDYLIKRMKEEIERNRPVLKPDELKEYEEALAIYERIAATAQ